MVNAEASALPQIAGYQVTRLLQHGGMADVYLGTQLSLQRPVAIKVLAADRSQGEETIARFEHEARTIARLDHPHIVGIHDVGTTADGRLFYTMPYLPRGDLGDRKVDERGVVAILRALCGALGYAHEHGIVHRDVKPGNILFDQRDRPLLADFGIALTTLDMSRVTREGSTIGSGGYMSPEQARGLPLDGRADLYSLGVVTYELLSGDLPFHAPDTLSMALAHVEQPVPRLSAQRARWQAFIDKAMAKNAADRFASAAQMAAALNVIEANIEGRATESLVLPAVVRSPRVVIGAGVLLLIGVAAITTAYMRQNSAVRQAVEPSAIGSAAAQPAAPSGGAAAKQDAAAAEAAPSTPLALASVPPSAADAKPGESAATDEKKPSAHEPASGTVPHDRLGPLLAVIPSTQAANNSHAIALARYEVTRGEYAAFVKATRRAQSDCREPNRPLSRLKDLNWRSPGFTQDDRHPVVCVSWRDAVAYAAWLSQVTHAEYRLPTRAEWLQAAHGVAGSGACTRGNLAGHRTLGILPGDGCKNAYEHTAPVGQFKANPYGVHDLVGNVSEWTLNCNSGVVDSGGHCSDHWYIGTSWRDGADANPLAIGDADANVGYTTVGIRLVRKIDAERK